MRDTLANRARLLAAGLLLLWPALTTAQEQPAVLEIVVNGVSAGEALVLLRGADVLVGVERLKAAGVDRFEGTRERNGQEELVSLASLSSVLTFAVNEADLQLRITAVAEVLPDRIRSLGVTAPRDLVYRSDESGFVNYSLNWTGEGGMDLFTESAARLGDTLAYTTVSIAKGTATRGLTSVTYDERARMRRWIIGDGFAQTGPLGGDAWAGGITVAREFGIQPYFVRHPSLSLSAPIPVPSTVEVHVNGRIVSQEQVAPGRLDVRNLPLTVGRNDASIVVRDTFGGSREIGASYYLASSVLAAGLHDYQYSVGYRREAPGATSWGYKEFVAMGRHRVGVTDAVTAGGRIELSPRLLSLGPSFNVRLPVGEIEAAAAASTGPGSRGGAALASYAFTGRPFGAGASLMKATSGYTVTSARPAAERPSVEGSVFGSVSLGSRLSVTGQHSQASLHGGAVRARSAAFATVYLSRSLQLGASAGRVRSESGVTREFHVVATLSFGRTSAAASVVRTPTGSGVVFEAQQPLPVGSGYGYQARAETTTPGRFSGALRYQNRYGRYELRRDMLGGPSITSASAMGSVVAIGGAVYASRPVEQSFALVQVGGVEGVRGYSSHQEVGRTDKRGNLLIPNLQPYYGNLLTISDTDIPLAYSVGGVRLTLAPPFRGGALAVFPVQSVTRVLGRVRVGGDGEDRTPVFGEIVVAADGMPPSTSPLGAEGDFYFENLPAGRHVATVRDSKGECSLTLNVPDSTDPVIELGVVRCVSSEGS